MRNINFVSDLVWLVLWIIMLSVLTIVIYSNI